MTNGETAQDSQPPAEARASGDATRRSQRTTSRSPTSEIIRLTRRERLQFECMKSALYHEDREHFFARMSKVTAIAILLCGTASYANAAESLGLTSVLLLLMTTLGVLDLVYKPGRMAGVHSQLRKDFWVLHAEAVKADDLRILDAQLHMLYATEPPTFHFVNCLAYNATMRSMGRDDDHHIVLNPWQRRFRHVLRGDASETETRVELGERSQSAKSVAPADN